MLNRFSLIGLAVVLPLCAAGCSENRETAAVSGQVTLDGKPLANARVHFQPALPPGQEPAAELVDSYGVTGPDGRFELRLGDTGEPGAIVGSHTVRISDAEAESEESDADAGFEMQKRPRIPSHYSDGSLSLDVPPGGTDQADFKLSSRPG
jgi:hypothetical protein